MNAIAQAIATRRSVYALNRELPLPPGEIVATIEHALRHAPSAFNSQSTRLLVLFGAEHEKLWDLTADALRAVVPAEAFAPTAEKIAGFRAAAGTVLFFEDRNIIKGLQERFPSYADTFPGSADQAGAMLQYALWTAFATQHIGANLGHPRQLAPARATRLRRHRGRAGRKGTCANGRAPARRRTLNYSNNSKSISSFIPPQQLRRFLCTRPSSHRGASTRIPAETDFHCRMHRKQHLKTLRR